MSINNPVPKTNARLLRLPEVRELTGLPTSTIYAKIAEGTFPRQIKLSARSVAWDGSQIDSWISARLTESSVEAL